MTQDVVTDPWHSEQVITCRDDSVGLKAVIAIDDTTLGPGFGGVRMRAYPSTEAAAREAQRLASAMTGKHALAELPYGGAKSVLVVGPETPQTGPDREALFARFGEFVARTAGSYVPGVDMGTTMADMQVIRDRGGARAFCDEVDPGPYTARGVYAAMRAAVRHRLGSDLDGVSVLVQGAGHVGSHLARYAAADGARVLVCDVDRARAEALAAELGAVSVDPEQAASTDVDVWAPCATARVLRAGMARQLKVRVVAGAANDVLDAPEVAAELQAAGITVVPDYVANAGGVIQVHAGVAGWSESELDAALERIGDRVADILVTADRDGTDPFTVAQARVRDRLAAAHTDRRSR